MKTAERIFWIVVIVGLIVFFLTRPKPAPDVVVERDTLTVWDTVRVETPVEVWRTVRDTMFIPVSDTLFVTHSDTVFLQLPRETALYTDSLYKAQISGYKPVLDWIEIYSPTQTIYIKETEKVKPSRVSVGLQAGYGVTTSGLSPYVGLGVGYRIF